MHTYFNEYMRMLDSTFFFFVVSLMLTHEHKLIQGSRLTFSLGCTGFFLLHQAKI